MLYGDATVKILLTLSVVGGCAFAAVVGHVEDIPVDANQFNVGANIVLIAMFGGACWGLRKWANSLLDTVKELRKDLVNNTVELTRVCTIVEARDGQQAQIDTLKSEVANLRVDVARLESGPPRRTTRKRSGE